MGSHGRCVRILYVEDRAETLDVVARLLRSLGHTVVTAGSCAEAREAATQKPFDLLIADVGLSDGSGLPLLAEIRERYWILGIVLSGYDREVDQTNSFEAGF